MFERFTDRARRVVVLAQEEARLLNHNYIGTEHILLGIVHEGEGVGAKALEVMRISLESVRREVEQIIGRGERVPSGHIPFTPRAKKVLELSLREAMQLGHNYIGTEHILLGLLREGEGVGAQALMKLGADLAQVRQAVIQLVSGYSGQMEAQPESAAPRLVSSSGPGVRAEQTCSFCGRDLLEVDRYVAGIGAVICDACVVAATDAVAGASSREVRLPPRVFGAHAPGAADISEIERAFSRVFSSGDDPDRASFLEDGVEIYRYLESIGQEFSEVDVQRVVIYGLRFDAPGTADVRFALHIGSGIGAFPCAGRAIRSASGWQVSRETFADLLARGGITLPPPNEIGPPTSSPGAPSPPPP